MHQVGVIFDMCETLQKSYHTDSTVKKAGMPSVGAISHEAVPVLIHTIPQWQYYRWQ